MSGKSKDTTRNGHYAKINGLNMYYEIHGKGKPLVLVHGAFGSIKTNFGNVLPSFAKTREVIAVEQQGHGHTADIDRPLSFKQMADDISALLTYLDIDNADIFGYSMGGDVTLQLAMNNPDLVRKIVFSGGPSYHPDGFYPEILNSDKMMRPGKPWKEYYNSIAPNPSDLPVVAKKIKKLIDAWEGISREDLKRIKAPMLLIVGDSDIVRLEHVVEMFRLLGGGIPGDIMDLPNSQLAVLPGTTHTTLLKRSDWLISMIMEFLEAPMPMLKN